MTNGEDDWREGLVRAFMFLLVALQLCAIIAAAIWCLHIGHEGFAVAFVVLAYMSACTVQSEDKKKEAK